MSYILCHIAKLSQLWFYIYLLFYTSTHLVALNYYYYILAYMTILCSNSESKTYTYILFIKNDCIKRKGKCFMYVIKWENMKKL